ncbi:TPA: site-specific integrase [Bacillus cereus]|uniref:site-specific integrase n=1 Tax=Bacillus TaxID=1386 RepID=UPI000886B551|nr:MULTISPECIES: site-specific integrase [Bacillus]ASK14454.1 integrase [Bacillus cereus]MBL3782095.1 site-specific integrase [Bacillus cereus]MBL3800639.1 site-specific integrase [Bacillus cereus]MBL3813416.1 site-specific integrase [Bacillus cereus]MCU5251845.1 site-specific integrase [Bacillus cereus]
MSGVVQPIRSKRDIDKMKKALAGKPRDLLLFIFGINSALRISDILKLKVGDVSGKESISLKETKTRKSKRFHLNASIKKAVVELIPPTADDNDWLFPSRKGDKAISRIQAYRILNTAADRAGLNIEIGTHTLRKTFAFHAYKNGTDLALLQTILNHSSQRETLVYLCIEQKQIDDVYIEINL